MRKGTPITLYLDEQTLALLDSEVSRRSQQDINSGKTGYAVANRSKLASEAIEYAIQQWNTNNLTLEKIKDITGPIFFDYGVISADVFGSFARNEQNEESDIDFLVTLGKPLGLKFFSMQNKLSQALGRPVDVQTEAAANASFLEQIRKDRVNIYAA